MNNQSILKQVEQILQRILQSDDISINDTTSLTRDLSFDSLMFVELVVSIETAFLFTFDTEYLLIEKIDNIGDLTKYIAEKVSMDG